LTKYEGDSIYFKYIVLYANDSAAVVTLHIAAFSNYLWAGIGDVWSPGECL